MIPFGKQCDSVGARRIGLPRLRQDQGGELFLKEGYPRIIGCIKQLIERKLRLRRQYPLRCCRARVTPDPIKIAGIAYLLGAVRAGGPPRPVVDVKGPAIGRIHHVRQLALRVQPLPCSRGVAAVDGLGIIQTRIAARQELRQKQRSLARVAGE